MSGRVCHQRQQWRSLTMVLVVVAAANIVGGEIHRAKAANSRPYNSARLGHARARLGQQLSAFEDDHLNVTNRLENLDEWLCNAFNLEGRSHIWILSLASAAVVGLSGVLPLLLIPLQVGEALNRGGEANHRLKLLLSFAVGGLLGDVFLHLLPEAWAHLDKLGGTHDGNITVGCWVLTGLLIFMFIEKLFPENDNNEDSNSEDTQLMQQPVENVMSSIRSHNSAAVKRNGQTVNKKQKCASRNSIGLVNIIDGIAHSNGISGFAQCDDVSGMGINRSDGIHEYSCSSIINGYMRSVAHVDDCEKKLTQRQLHDGKIGLHKQDGSVCASGSLSANTQHIKTSGWLNLMANVIDNFTHGLAVAGSFSVSVRTGYITLFAILLHEIPHEVGDFAILLKSGFDRWTAAKAQLLTATGGILGALAALTAESAQSAGDRSAWILPFTSGGFLYIAMVTVLPDLLRETNPMQSLKQFVMVCSGIAVMAAVTVLTE